MIGRFCLRAVLAVLLSTLPAAAGSIPSVGGAAPEYAAATLDGDAVDLAELRGRVVLLKFWASWCEPCLDEMPAFNALHRQWSPQGLQVVGVSIDEPHAEAELRAAVRDLGIEFRVLWDSQQKALRIFRIPAIPATFLIGRDGRILQIWRGTLPEGTSTDEAILQALKQPPVRVLPGRQR